MWRREHRRRLSRLWCWPKEACKCCLLSIHEKFIIRFTHSHTFPNKQELPKHPQARGRCNLLTIGNCHFETSTAKFLWAAQTGKELHTSSWNCMQAHGTSCKHREQHASSWSCMQAHQSVCNLTDLHTISFYLKQSLYIRPVWNMYLGGFDPETSLFLLHASLNNCMQAYVIACKPM